MLARVLEISGEVRPGSSVWHVVKCWLYVRRAAIRLVIQ